jgi:hypothetical protein
MRAVYKEKLLPDEYLLFTLLSCHLARIHFVFAAGSTESFAAII